MYSTAHVKGKCPTRVTRRVHAGMAHETCMEVLLSPVCNIHTRTVLYTHAYYTCVCTVKCVQMGNPPMIDCLWYRKPV